MAGNQKSFFHPRCHISVLELELSKLVLQEVFVSFAKYVDRNKVLYKIKEQNALYFSSVFTHSLFSVFFKSHAPIVYSVIKKSKNHCFKWHILTIFFTPTPISFFHHQQQKQLFLFLFFLLSNRFSNQSPETHRFPIRPSPRQRDLRLRFSPTQLPPQLLYLPHPHPQIRPLQTLLPPRQSPPSTQIRIPTHYPYPLLLPYQNLRRSQFTRQSPQHFLHHASIQYQTFSQTP